MSSIYLQVNVHAKVEKIRSIISINGSMVDPFFIIKEPDYVLVNLFFLQNGLLSLYCDQLYWFQFHYLTASIASMQTKRYIVLTPQDILSDHP